LSTKEKDERLEQSGKKGPSPPIVSEREISTQRKENELRHGRRGTVRRGQCYAGSANELEHLNRQEVKPQKRKQVRNTKEKFGRKGGMPTRPTTHFKFWTESEKTSFRSNKAVRKKSRKGAVEEGGNSWGLRLRHPEGALR